MSQRYAIVEDATGKVRNIILWDGETPYDPGEGFTLRPATDEDSIEED